MPSEREIRKTLFKWFTYSHRVFLLLIENFSASTGCAAAAAGGNLGSWGYPSTSVLAGLLPAKIANMYIFALLADFIPKSG